MFTNTYSHRNTEFPSKKKDINDNNNSLNLFNCRRKIQCLFLQGQSRPLTTLKLFKAGCIKATHDNTLLM